MIKKTNFHYAFFVVLFLIFPSQLALNSPWSIVLKLSVFIVIGAGILLFFTRKNLHFSKAATPVLSMLAMLLIVSILSSYLNEWLRPVLSYGVFIIISMLSIVLFDRLSSPVYFVQILVLGVVFTSLVLVASSLLFEPISLYRFQGIFNNPNSMGWLTGGVSALLLGALYENRLIWSKMQRNFLYAALVMHLLLLLASNSRAALLAVISVILVFFVFYLVDSISLTRIHLNNLFRLLKISIFFILISISIYFLGFLDPIIDKFIINYAKGDISSSRLDIWLASIEHWTWLGLGPNYAELIGRADEATGHSTYIHQLSRYGLAPALLFIMILLYIWLYAFRSTKNHARIAPTLIAILTSFLVNAAFESGAATPGMWLSVLIFGALLSESKIRRKYI
jgi:O-antigen ligase